MLGQVKMYHYCCLWWFVSLKVCLRNFWLLSSLFKNPEWRPQITVWVQLNVRLLEFLELSKGIAELLHLTWGTNDETTPGFWNRLRPPEVSSGCTANCLRPTATCVCAWCVHHMLICKRTSMFTAIFSPWSKRRSSVGSVWTLRVSKVRSAAAAAGPH